MISYVNLRISKFNLSLWLDLSVEEVCIIMKLSHKLIISKGSKPPYFNSIGPPLGVMDKSTERYCITWLYWNSLGHSWSLQMLTSRSFPGQASPPLPWPSQVLFLLCIPPAHDALHVVQGVHVVQTPFTEIWVVEQIIGLCITLSMFRSILQGFKMWFCLSELVQLPFWSFFAYSRFMY